MTASGSAPIQQLPKSPTGIQGLDEITGGGLPRGRPTLVCGGPGSGKTLLGASFLVNGIERFGEPGLLISFEENGEELASDVASLGFDLSRLIAEQKLVIDFVRVERSEIEETGEYDLEGLFVRIDHGIRSIGARRIVLDTIEALFAGLSNQAVLRAELRRLFRWLKNRQITAVVTAERGDGSLTRQGLEEYVSDAVILLDHRVREQISTRRLRIVKYRGSHHGSNEYPFLIDRDGLSVLPITSLSLAHEAAAERISTGLPQLDALLGGGGYFRGSTALVSGTAGSGKTSIAAHFAAAACGRGERCLYFLSEESPQQFMRNMSSIGIDLRRHVDRGLLRFRAERPSRVGLETHLLTLYREVRDYAPAVVVVDPVTSLLTIGSQHEVRSMLTRVIDQLKTLSITALFTSLTVAASEPQDSDVGVSSLMDSWILLTLDVDEHERRRHIAVLKARGMGHSNRIFEFQLTTHGLRLLGTDSEPRVVARGQGV
jgi:circadian clock protein KaiC